jgi:phosphogluconate dehydratase
MSPEALDGGALARLRNGDVLSLDADAGSLEVLIKPETFAARLIEVPKPANEANTLGRNLFDIFRHGSSSARSGAAVF